MSLNFKSLTIDELDQLTIEQLGGLELDTFNTHVPCKVECVGDYNSLYNVEIVNDYNSLYNVETVADYNTYYTIEYIGDYNS